jgi:hypothetical protein
LNFDAAESGELLVKRDLLVGPCRTRRRYKRAAGDDFRGEDVSLIQRELLELRAAALGSLGYSRGGKQERGCEESE